MDLDKIFLKDACPTSIGGQAILEGVMMKGPEKTALSVRVADDKIITEEMPTKKPAKIAKMPFIRGSYVFFISLISGLKILMRSATIIEEHMEDPEDIKPSKFEEWATAKFGEKGASNIALYGSMLFAIVFSLAVFIILPTWVCSLVKYVTENIFILNLVEGILRMALFILYLWIISLTPDMYRFFQYHGAEHQTIHAFENGLELTPENCRAFPTLHPRCGTSFIVFVFIIALLFHMVLGWPNLAFRIISRLLLLPVIAGVSYELLKIAGSCDNKLIKALSIPGLLVQKITTKTPTDDMLEVAIASMKVAIQTKD